MSDTCLRSNTFVLLLLRSCNPELSAYEGWGQKGTGVTKPNMLLELLQMIDPNHSPNMRTLGQYFSQFLDGSRPSSKAHPFLDSTFTSKFTMRMNSEYDAVLKQMDDFCKTYLDFESDNSMKQLVAGLSVAIYNDKTIPTNTQFYTGHEMITKANLPKHRDFILQPFLLSVWHYVVTKKPDAAEAAQTYEDWTGEAEKNSPALVTTKLGLGKAGEFNVNKDISDILPNDVTIEDEFENSENPEAAENVEVKEAPIDSSPTSESEQPKVVYQTINNWNNKEGGIQIGHIENLSLVWGKK